MALDETHYNSVTIGRIISRLNKWQENWHKEGVRHAKGSTPYDELIEIQGMMNLFVGQNTQFNGNN